MSLDTRGIFAHGNASRVDLFKTTGAAYQADLPNVSPNPCTVTPERNTIFGLTSTGVWLLGFVDFRSIRTTVEHGECHCQIIDTVALCVSSPEGICQEIGCGPHAITNFLLEKVKSWDNARQKAAERSGVIRAKLTEIGQSLKRVHMLQE